MAELYFCRLCAIQKTESIDIYTEEGFKLKLEAKIIKYLEIQVGVKDHLPKIVCHDCLEKLLLFEEFIECTKQAQATLKMLYTEVPCKVEVVDTKQEIDIYNSINQIEENKDGVDTQGYMNCQISSNGFSSVPQLQISEDDKITDDLKPELEKEVITKVSGNIEQHLDLNIKYKELSSSSISLVNDEINLDQNSSPEIVIDTLDEDKLRAVGVLSYSSINVVTENETLISSETTELITVPPDEIPESSSTLEINNCQLPRKRREGWDKYPWLCTDCEEKLPSMQALRQHHQIVHNQQPRFMCAECRKVYTKYYGFVSHVRRHKNHMKFCCDQCGKCFSNKKVLESHTGTHSDARPYVCQECGKSFRQQSALYVHQKSHQPEGIKNRFPCDQCDKKFSTKPNLVTHKRIHTGIRNFTCEQCGKSFIQKGNLDAHILTHSVDKPHTCSICNKGFKTPLQLKKHTSVHTGAKPHQCDVCGRQFRERGTLREHHRIHTGAMPFTCEFCGKCFRFKGILTTHRRQHTGERPYSCLECQHHFTNWPNYNKHMKRRHGINTSIQPDPNKIAMAAAAEIVANVGVTNNTRIVVQTPTNDSNNPLCNSTINLDHVYDTVTPNVSDPLDLGSIEYHYTSSSVPYDSNQSNPTVNSSTQVTPMLGYYNLSELHVIEPETTIDILQHR